MTPFILFFVSHSSILKPELLLLIEINCKVLPCLTYFLSFLTTPSLLSGESHHLLAPQMYQLVLLLTFVRLLLISGKLMPLLCLSVYSLLHLMACSAQSNLTDATELSLTAQSWQIYGSWISKLFTVYNSGSQAQLIFKINWKGFSKNYMKIYLKYRFLSPTSKILFWDRSGVEPRNLLKNTPNP